MANWWWIFLVVFASKRTLSYDRIIHPHACGLAEKKGRRLEQQDRLQCETVDIRRNGGRCSPAMVVGVFDGHGGSRASQLAQDTVVHAVQWELERSWNQEWDPCDVVPHEGRKWLEGLVKQTVQELDEEYYVQGGREDGHEGTTLLLAVLFEKDVMVATVGDTRGMFCSLTDNGLSASQTTADHNWKNLQERERIEDSGGKFHARPGQHLMRVEGELAITRAVGDFNYRSSGVISEPDVTWWTVGREDILFFASTDGVFETMEPSKVCNFAWKFLTDSPYPPLTPEASAPIAMPHIQGDVCHANAAGNNVATDTGSAQIQEKEAETFPSAYAQSASSVKKLNWVAESILEESYNRVSLDNLAIALVILNPTAILNGLPKGDEAATIPALSLSLPGSAGTAIVPVRGYMLDTVIGVQGYAMMHYHLSSGNQVSVFNPSRGSTSPKQLIINGVCLEEDFPGIAEKLAKVPLFLPEATQSMQELANDHSDTDNLDRGFYHILGGVGRGSFGEAWRAQRLNATSKTFVVKRLFVEKSLDVKLSGEREIYFGHKLQKLNGLQDEVGLDLSGDEHLVRFVESFEAAGPLGDELWLVFEDEGLSLHSYVYEVAAETSEQRTVGSLGTQIDVVQPSRWWISCRQSEEGNAMLIEIFKQIVEAVQSCHLRGIAHRDVKMENVMIRFDASGFPHVRLIDFGSAVDEYTMEHMFNDGPSRTEQTSQYEPPESLFSDGLGKQRIDRYFKYDVWSLGILALELFTLGTSDVFVLDPRTRAYISSRMEKRDPQSLHLAYLLRSMMELCIYPPGPSDDLDHDPQASSRMGRSDTSRSHTFLAPWDCSEEHLLHMFRRRDPLGQGLPGVWCLRLVRRLLHWNPASRPSSEEILQHAFFRRRGGGYPCTCGSEVEFPWQASRCEDGCTSMGVVA